MRKLSFLSILTAITIAVGVNTYFQRESIAQPQTGTYFCANSRDNTPTTYRLTSTGKKRAVIRWAKYLGKYTPQQRCEIVSKNFQQAYDANVLNYLTPGYQKGLPIVCASKDYGGNCDRMLFTLSKGQKAHKVIEELTNTEAGYPIVQGGISKQPYYSMEDILKNNSEE